MYAQVYPIIRLPRRFGFFDYSVPKGLQLSAGDVVSVPLKGRTVLGVVRSISKSTEVKRALPVGNIAAKSFLSQDDVSRIEQVAHEIIQSPSSVLYTALQGWKPIAGSVVLSEPSNQRPSISRTTATDVQAAFQALTEHDRVFFQNSIEGVLALAHAIQARVPGQVLVLAPTERLSNQAARHLPGAAVLHGRSRGRSAIINAWQDGSLRLLVGTRQASLLPVKDLAMIIVLESTNTEHKSTRRNPRFDARHCVKLLVEQYDPKILFTGTMPRVEDLSYPVITYSVSMPSIISLDRKEQLSDIPLVSDALLEHLQTTLDAGRQALLIYNKKGFAGRLVCGKCKHVPFCGSCGAVPRVRSTDLLCSICHAEMWHPKSCPSCGSTSLKPRGIGNERLMNLLKARFPGVSIELIDKQHPGTGRANIMIATEYFFEHYARPFGQKRFGLVADVCSDLSLGTLFDGAIEYASRLHRLTLYAHSQRAHCLIQTWSPDRALSAFKTIDYLKAEAEHRKTYNLPPTSIRMVVTDTSDPHHIKSLHESAKNLLEIQSFLQNEHELELLTKPKNSGKLHQLLSELPDSCIISVDL